MARKSQFKLFSTRKRKPYFQRTRFFKEKREALREPITTTLALSILLSTVVLPAMSNAQEDSINAFVNRLKYNSHSLDSIASFEIDLGLRSIVSYLREKDGGKFSELYRETEDLDRFLSNALRIYDMRLIEFASEYFKWSNSKAPNVTPTFLHREAPHFIFYFAHNFTEERMGFIIRESEKLYDSLIHAFKPDSSMLDNFQRLSIYDSWAKGLFTQKSGELKSTNKKMIVVVVNNRNSVQELSGGSPNMMTEAVTEFGVKYLPEQKRIVNTWISIVPFASPLSLIVLVHEITHTFIAAIYSNPFIIEAYMREHDLTEMSSLIPDSIYVRTIARPNILTLEGVAVWAGFQFTPFTTIGFLPEAYAAAHDIDLMTLKDLLNNDVTSFQIKNPSTQVDRINTFFLSSGSFMKYMIDNYTSEQLKALFTGTSSIISVDEIEHICGKPIKDIEEEWHRFSGN